MKRYFMTYGFLEYVDYYEAIENPFMEFVDEDLDEYDIMCDIVCDCGVDYYWTAWGE